MLSCQGGRGGGVVAFLVSCFDCCVGASDLVLFTFVVLVCESVFGTSDVVLITFFLVLV